MELLSSSFWRSTFSRPTPFLGLKLWLFLALLAAMLSSLLLLLVIPLCLSLRHRRRAPSVPLCKLSPEDPVKLEEPFPHYAEAPPPRPQIKVEAGKPEHQVVVADHAINRGGHVQRKAGPEVSHLGWGHWYTLRELEEATGGLAPDNVIGEGGYGIVYKGILPDDTMVAVKNLFNNRGQAEKEFKMEVEAIGRVRHKNLVRLLGYCVEGAYRMLVYEYVDNGNLAHWLHGDVGQISPLTWDMRMNIILGTAKGLTYLHEGLEPKVVHRDVKSSNILLDKHWNPKVSDFGLAKLLCSDTNHVTTRVMGTFGYVAPEYASTGMLNEKSDIYSFGVLVMEIISGREPVDYARPPEEVHLVEWLRNMVADRKSFQVLDPKITEQPCPKAMKRALLVALHCVDPDARRRPKMGHVIHMFESDDLLLHDEKKIARGESSSLRDYSKRTLGRQKLNDAEINPNLDRTNWR